MVSSRVRFLFTRCGESQTHSLEIARSFVILHNSWIKSYALTNHEVISMYCTCVIESHSYKVNYWFNVVII